MSAARGTGGGDLGEVEGGFFGRFFGLPGNLLLGVVGGTTGG